MKPVVRMIIQKLVAINLVWIAAVFQISFWAVFIPGDNMFEELLLHKYLGVDPFFTIVTCIFIGFSILWILGLKQGFIKEWVPISLLVLLAIAGGLTLIISSPSGTTKGWFVMSYINTFTFAVNGIFAFAYALFGKVKRI